MTARDLIQYTTWVVYVLIFLSTAVRAVRRPLRANIDIALFFLIPTLIIIQSSLIGLQIEPNSPPLVAITIALLPAWSYLLLRLVDDFSDVSEWLMRSCAVLFVAGVVGAFYFAGSYPVWFLLALIAYMIGLFIYSGIAFILEARKTRGVTNRRMSAAATGTIFLFALFLVLGVGVGLREVYPSMLEAIQPLSTLAGLASGIFYFLGFAPPTVLRSAWQEPELRAFLGRAASLPRLSTTEAIVAELERGAAASIGTAEANIGLWDEAEQALRFKVGDDYNYVAASNDSLTGRTFIDQEPTYTDNLLRDSPLAARQKSSSKTFLAAPISTKDRRLGVLITHSSHVPIFADEDMRLIKLLADQAAVILESRSLIDEATRVRTREEVTRLKEDFLSAAAHDLKTPLTSLVGQAQLLERRAERNPDAPANIEGIRTIAREANRLKGLVLELLDAARAEEGKLLGDFEEVDLVAQAQEVCARHNSARHQCRVEAATGVVGMFDQSRIRQLLENLVENAVKYSPEGGAVIVRIGIVGDRAQFSVRDHGIGIPASDLAHVFDRFHRGTNVDDRRFSGMGLGLYICHEIVEQHGGTINVSSRRGEGTTFMIELPLQPLGNTESAKEADPVATSEADRGNGMEYAPRSSNESRHLEPIMGQKPFTPQEEGQPT